MASASSVHNSAATRHQPWHAVDGIVSDYYFWQNVNWNIYGWLQVGISTLLCLNLESEMSLMHLAVFSSQVDLVQQYRVVLVRIVTRLHTHCCRDRFNMIQVSL